MHIFRGNRVLHSGLGDFANSDIAKRYDMGLLQLSEHGRSITATSIAAQYGSSSATIPWTLFQLQAAALVVCPSASRALADHTFP